MSEPRAARTARQPAAAPGRRVALRQWLVASVTVAACGGGQRPDTSGSGPENLPERLAANPGDAEAAAPPAEGENALGLTRKAKDRKPQDAVLLHTITPPGGFVDTPLTFDAAGGRLLYVNTDAAELCELVVFDLNSKAEVMRVDLKAFTTAPLAVHDVIDGEHFLVLARPAAGVSAAIVDRKGAVSRKFGPATDIVRTQYDGEDALAVYLREEVPAGKSKKKAPTVRHTIDLFALATGKRLGKRAVVTTDLEGFSAKLDFKVNHWLSGYTRVVGVKGGEYDRKEDQRSPDVEAWLDVPRSTFAKKTPIADVVEHTKRLQILAQHPNESTFIAIAPDLAGLHAYADGAGPAPIELAEPFRHYLHTTLVTQPAQPGQPVFFTLEIDPVHPDAVARKRAEEKWLDLYAFTPGLKKAERVARLPIDDGDPGYRWRARPTLWAVVPRHVGFERGGASIQVYQSKPAQPSKAGRREPQPGGPGHHAAHDGAEQEHQGQEPQYQARAGE